jgi:hypothetical protein
MLVLLHYELDYFKEVNMLFKIGIVIGILLVLAAGPLLIVWSLNTLFPALLIPYTLNTWAAAVLLGGLLSAKFK